MNEITINLIDSLSFYKKCLQGNVTEEDFRYDLMRPFKKMWHYLNAPMFPKNAGGYDVIMAAEMLGIWTPRKTSQLIEKQVDSLKDTKIFEDCVTVINNGIQQFNHLGYTIPLDKITLTILLGDPENKLLMANQGYSGFGGIPGYIMLFVYPNAFNKTRLKSALAHEFNHTIRFTYEPFNHGNVSVQEYLVIEGLAEVFAEKLYGIKNRGPWVQDYDEEEMAYTIEIMKEGRKLKGFEQVSAYMYGDEVAREQGYQPVGVSRNAGYTIGYHMIKEYLKNTGESIEQATLTPSDRIITESKIFT